MTMDAFLGKWQVTGTENMEEMLKTLDMEEAKRQMYADMRFILEYSREGDDWSYTVSAPEGGFSKTIAFQLGKPFDSYTLDGRPILSKIEAKDGRFVEVHNDKADPTLDAHIVKEIIKQELVVTATVRDVSSITRHKRID